MSTATAEPTLEDRPATEPEPGTPPDEPAPGDAQPGSTPPPGEGEPEQENFPPAPDEPVDEPGEDPERERVEASEPSRRQLSELDGEREHYVERVREIMGEFVAGMVECEHCHGLGMRAPDAEPRAHPWFKQCPTCAGYGQVLTGSRDEQHLGVPCPRCLGRGYLEALDSSGTPLRELPAVTSGDAGGNAAASGSLAGAQFADDPAAVLEPAGHGTPAWMGDTNLGQ